MEIPVIHLNFDPEVVLREIKKEPFEDGRRSVGLGSVFSLTPSGKYYQPFACGNLNDCPVCQGSGDAPRTLKRRVLRKWRNENRRRRKLWIKRFSSPRFWPRYVHAQSDALNKKARRVDASCPRCGGLGCAEAHDDEIWQSMAEEALSAVGLSLEVSEGDSTYYLAVEYQDEGDTEEGDDE